MLGNRYIIPLYVKCWCTGMYCTTMKLTCSNGTGLVTTKVKHELGSWFVDTQCSEVVMKLRW